MSIEQQAVFGGGCFWCTEAIFQSLKGVLDVESGFAGGDSVDPTYDEVGEGETGHAEVIQVTYDPAIIDYEDLVRVHLGTHDPTTPDAQGTDYGTQYRSIILVNGSDEQQIAESVIEGYGEALDDDVVTEVRYLDTFHPADDSHQNYYRINFSNPYSQSVIDPKLTDFRDAFAHLLV